MKKTTFKKFYTRERSLFYFYIWQIAELNTPEMKFTRIVIRFKSDEQPNVWYDPKELDRYCCLVKKWSDDFDFVKKEVDNYLAITKQLDEYIQGIRPLKTIQDLKKLKDLYLEYWPRLSNVFSIPDFSENDQSKQYALKVRAETERFSDEINDLIVNFVIKRFPELKEFVNVILPEEIFNLEDEEFRKNMRPDLMKRRNNTFYFYNNKIYFEEEFKKQDVWLKEEEPESNDFAKGEVAFKGVTTGTARVVNLQKDLEKIQDGDILITQITAPCFVPFLKKVKAIVADEGGIASHPAILARELKIPCIVGTKYATKIFKDNDLIEVNADKGVVSRK